MSSTPNEAIDPEALYAITVYRPFFVLGTRFNPGPGTHQLRGAFVEQFLECISSYTKLEEN